MLLKALYDFAHSRKWLDDPAFPLKAIRWVIQLDANGRVIGAGPIDTSEDGKRGKEFFAPATSRPKVAGGVAEFLADGITAIFGLDLDPEKDRENERRRKERDANNAAKHEDFWRQIQAAYDETGHGGLRALLKARDGGFRHDGFLIWKAKEEGEKPGWWLRTAKGEEVKLKPDNFTFQVGGDLLIEDETLRAWWRKTHEQEVSSREQGSTRGLCMITGAENVPIAPTHPKIKGVRGAKGTGALLVSFDKAAFTSYGFEQSANAPASFPAATAYSAALNQLLSNDRHSLRVGGATICFWARDSEEATDIFTWAFEQPKPESVRDFLKSPRTGAASPLSQPDDFYSLTLSGNGGRVVVRHWMQIPLEMAVENLRRWFDDLGIATYGDRSGDEKSPPLGLFRLSLTTVREAKDLQADVPAHLYRAALEGTPPPLSLLNGILKRLEVDLIKNGPHLALRNLSRFALLRLILNRNRKEMEPMIEPQVFETTDPAYNCGRLLALFDDLQHQALSEPGKPFDGAGVVERYYGTASTAPNSAFGILWRLHQHHLKKLSRQGERGRAAAEAIKRKIAEIAALFPQPAPQQPPQFPRTFGLQEQGRFALGFYQQKAADDAARRARRERKDEDNDQPNS